MATENFYDAVGLTQLAMGRAITNADTTFTVTTNQTMVAVTGLSQFRFMFQDGTDEICICSNVASNTWTVSRGQEGSSAMGHIDGTRIVPVITAAGLATISVGTTLNWRGTWSPSITYGLNDAVSFNGSSYVSTNASNTSNQPDTNPSDWTLIAQKGDQGIQGTTGSQGIQGTQGIQGIQGVQGVQGPIGPGFAWRGTYNPATAYSANDVIGYNGSAYVALGSSTGHQPDTHSADWSIFAAGSGMVWLGAWNSTTAYAINDAVSFNSSSYISLVTANFGHQPDTSPSDWGLMAAAGSAGMTGEIIGQVLYLDDKPSDIASYFSLLNIPVDTYSEVATPVAVNSGAGEVLIGAFATDLGNPGSSQIPGGPWTFNVWADVDDSTASSQVKVRVYHRTTGGTETDLFNDQTISLTTVAGSLYQIQTTQPDIQIVNSDRIVFKFFAVSASGSNRTVTMYWNGLAHYSNVKSPITVIGTAGGSGGGGGDWIEGTTDPPTLSASDGVMYLVLDSTSIGTLVGGDFGGTLTVPRVIGIQGTPISITTPTDGQVLQYSNIDAQWEPKTIDSVGTFASLPTSGMSLGDVYKCIDAPYEFVYDGTIWKAFGLTTSMVNPIDLTAFTAADTGSATVVNYGSVSLTHNIGSLDVVARYTTPISGTPPFSVTTCVQRFIPYNGDSHIGLVLQDSASSRILFFRIHNNGSFIISHYNTSTSNNADVGAANPSSSGNIFLYCPIWLRMTISGGTMTASYSYDGTQFIDHYSESSTAWLTSAVAAGIGWNNCYGNFTSFVVA